MNIETYQTLTGLTVTNEPLTEAIITKTRLQLETLLGYSLLRNKILDNQYKELGISPTDYTYSSTTVLNDPDDVIGAYRLFNYNKNDKFIPIDPFVTVHKVKLVYIKMGEEPNGVTLKTFESDEIRVHTKGGISKYIQNCDNCECVCDCSDCVQMAVDADWFYDDCLPQDLQMIWAEMITEGVDPQSGIKSETLGSHSYTKFDKKDTYNITMSILKKYAGPNGSLYRTIA